MAGAASYRRRWGIERDWVFAIIPFWKELLAAAGRPLIGDENLSARSPQDARLGEVEQREVVVPAGALSLLLLLQLSEFVLQYDVRCTNRRVLTLYKRIVPCNSSVPSPSCEHIPAQTGLFSTSAIRYEV